MSSNSQTEQAVQTLYAQMLADWNERNGAAFASHFAEDGDVVGFDGSQYQGRSEIAAQLERIFADHVTPTYVGKVKAVRLLGADVVLLSAIAGLVPRGQMDIAPNLNAIQSLVAHQQDGRWWVALFQNTPAQLHGRPELAEQISEELRQLLK